MNKIKNKWLRITGIVSSMIVIALLARPLISTLLGEKISVFLFWIIQWIHGCYRLCCFSYYRTPNYLYNRTS